MLLDVAHRRQPRRTAYGVAAEGGNMPQCGVVRERRHHLAARCKGPEGHTSAQSLSQTDYVGRDAVLGHGEHLARTSHAGLYLIENEHRPHFVAAAAQSLEVSRLRRPHARLALHRLAQHARRAARDLRKILHAVETYGPRVGQQRPERPFPLLALGRPHHAHGAVCRAVVCLPHGDHLGTAGISLCKLQRPFDRLGARIDEVYAVDRVGHGRRETRGILHLRPLDQLSVDHNVHVVGRLPLHGPHHIGVAVTDVTHRHPRHKVVIALALGRIEKDAFGTRHLDHHGRRRCLRHMGHKLPSQYIAHSLQFYSSPLQSRPKRRSIIWRASRTDDITQRNITSLRSVSVSAHATSDRRMRRESM